MNYNGDKDAIAVIGMAGRFPGARDIAEYWQNLVAGVESITFFTDEELLAAGVPREDLAEPHYVRAAPVIDQPEWLDAALFGLTSREAEVLDPQHRVFLETTYSAFRHAGYDPYGYDGRVGVFAGSRSNEYMAGNITKNATMFRAVGSLMTILANHTDYLSTRVAYQFGLRGPALSVVTACSTSLVAVHLAVRALRGEECEMAVAGGVEIALPMGTGYRYADGGILSPDGHIRSFDARAKGTVFGSGCGALLLKPLRAALADGDTVHAVIRGSAINNDGSAKTAFSAPSEAGQVEVVTAALRDAGVDAETLGYIEAHGTGTFVGDPIEFNALSRALRAATDRRGYCALGSVKANIGHLGAAAGIAGLIKAVHCVGKGVLPPTINFEAPNPQINLAESPFAINTDLIVWHPEHGVRRAGVSSFGIGGTNAHVIIEEAPSPRSAPPPASPYQLLALSGRTSTALGASAAQLSEHVRAESDQLCDVANTLAAGRSALPFRGFVVARDPRDAATRLAALRPASPAPRQDRPVSFLFPGQGSQHLDMARDLYELKSAFAFWFDRCAEALRRTHGLDLHSAIFATSGPQAAAAALNQTSVTQPALFAVEYSLAMQLREWGVRPTSMAGHSIGEYVAAALAGVFSFEDGLRLVADRGAFMQALPAGSMLAVRLPEAHLVPMLTDAVSLAAVNASGLCVVSGPTADVNDLERLLFVQGIVCRPLHTSHAFHSAMMDPILDEFRDRVAAVDLAAPQIPYVSNLTGTWITPEEAADPGYWVRHLRGCVRFADAVRLLHRGGANLLLEVGPGQTLSGSAGDGAEAIPVISAMRHPRQDSHDVKVLLEGVGKLWAHGGEVDLGRLWAGQGRRRVPLPDYPYERQRFWIEPDEESGPAAAAGPADTSPFSVPVWRETARPEAGPVGQHSPWVVFTPEGDGLFGPLVRRLRGAGANVVTVTPAVEYQRSGDSVGIRPTEPEDYARLLGEIAESAPDRLRVVHGWAVGTSPDGLDELGAARRWLELGFHSALAAMQACASMMASGTAVDVCILSSDMQDVAGDGDIEPAKAAVIGLVKHGPKEFENLACRSVDITLRDGASGPAAAGLLYAELTATPGHEQVAYRGRKRWTWSYDSITLDPAAGVPPTLKVGGVYLITGGLGGLGLALARQLAELAGARLVLISRAGLPGRGQWDVLAAAGPGDVVAERILAIRELEALGAEVLVCAADVTDEKEMRGVRAAVQERFGGVDGVFHLAAIAGGGMLESRTRAAAEQVFAPKVYGCYVLDAVFGGDVDLMVLYSSITVLTADFGLGDYTGANAVMDAFAQRRWAAGRRVLSINWPAWAEVGMAAGLHRPKILQRMREPGYSTDVSHPLFSGRSGQADRVATFYVDASAAQWVLAEHRFSGCPTMPASGFVELMRAAFEELAGNPRAEISNLVFPQLLMENKDEDVRLQATATGDGGYDIVVSGFSAGRDPVEYARCHVSAAEPGEPPRHDLAAVRAQCLAETTPARGPIGSLTLGPRWDNLTARSSGPDLEVLDLELPAVFAADLESYYLHPALLDSATALGYYLLPALLDGAAAGGQSKAEEDGDGPAGVSDDTGPAGGTLADVMPFGYDRLAVRGPLPVRCQAVIRKRLGGSSDVVQYDIVLTDADGIELVAIDGFTMVRTRDVADITGGEAGQIASRPSTANRAKSDVGALFDPSRAEAGVFPGEASEVLHRILAHADVPQVIWCPLGLAEGVRRAGKVTRASLVERATAAPVGSSLTRDLDTPYVEAATETERVLARLWQEALGIAQVGAEDDFFDLAGNSLIAVQLVARIGQRFGVDITVAQLFEGRSVRGLASCVEKALLARVDSMTEGEALEALRRLDAAG